MMIRFLTTSAGVLAAGTTALYEVSTASQPAVVVGWSLMAGIAGAGTTWGLLIGKVKSNDLAIAAEKRDREKAVADLKSDVNIGFERMERSIERQTDSLAAAIDRNRCRHVEER